MKVWLVEAEDLTCIWDSWEKAKAYVRGEQERCEWEFMCADKEDEIWTRYFFKDCCGGYLEVNIVQYDVNEKPYIG